MELLLIFSTFTFATAGHAEGCFCLESFAWQFGALAVFLAWIDLLVYLKKLRTADSNTHQYVEQHCFDVSEIGLLASHLDDSICYTILYAVL